MMKHAGHCSLTEHALIQNPGQADFGLAVRPVADDFVRRESDRREDGLRRAAVDPEEFNRLK